MNAARIKRLESLLEHPLSEQEIARLERIKTMLEIDDNDAIWDVLAAMEYQRTYYEKLPEKIAAASAEILQNVSIAAEKEVALAQSRLAESVVEQAKKMSVRLNVAALLPAGLLALICLLAYGSLMLWAGYTMGTGQAHIPVMLLRMPSGILIGGLCMAGGLFLGVYAAREFSESQGGWRKGMLAALALLISGGVLFSLAV